MFLRGIGFYGFNDFVASMIKQLSGLTNASVGWLLVIPLLLAAIAMYLT